MNDASDQKTADGGAQTTFASALDWPLLTPAAGASGHAGDSSQMGGAVPSVPDDVTFLIGAGEQPDPPVSPSAAVCYVDLLPSELLVHILSFLTLRQQLEVQVVSRRWLQTVRTLLASRDQLDLSDLLDWDTCLLTNPQLEYALGLMPSLRDIRCSRGIVVWHGNPVATIASLCPRLVSANLANLDGYRYSLRDLGVSCPNLELLEPPEYSTDSDVAEVLPMLPRLRQLKFFLPDSYECWAVLPPTLEVLEIVLDHATVHHLARCPQLMELSLICSEDRPSQNIGATLRALPQLERLCLENEPVPLERLLPTKGFPQLRHLSFIEVGVNSRTLQLLPRLTPALLSLEIWHGRAMTEEGLLQLSRLKQLRSLKLKRVQGVTDAVLASLHGHRLRQLHLTDLDNVSPHAFRQLVKHCPELQLLGLVMARDTTSLYLMGNWRLLAYLLAPQQDITLCVRDGGVFRLRDWEAGYAPAAWQDVAPAVLKRRQLEDWYSSLREWQREQTQDRLVSSASNIGLGDGEASPRRFLFRRESPIMNAYYA